ncbi:uncharacterized protein LOC112566164 [Pomacea canaliculata]|uniref:uncharacterized protein LOC112566164 n=1 Tax=Pomacea canaliculata TaxID=400727 RepID=UPI000D738184|nr:uncharacterized protein LOC112566164 [Pomacea canaliculata]
MEGTSQSFILNISMKVWDTTGDMSDDTFYLIDGIINLYASIIVYFIGIPTNAFNCLVFWHQGLRDRVNLCLFALASVDLLTLSLNFVISFVQPFIGLVSRPLREEFGMKAQSYTAGVVYGLHATSDVISTIIAVDRCLCVVCPLRVAHLIRTRTMVAVMATSFVFLQLSYAMLPIKFTVASVYVNSTGTYRWKMVQTDIELKYGNILDPFTVTFLSIALPITTFIIVSASTTVTVLKLMSATRWREKTSSVKRGTLGHQAGATKMLVLVSCLYIVTMAPYVASFFARLAVKDFSPFGRYCKLFVAVLLITDLFFLINNAGNFFVYIAQSSRFRRDLRVVLCNNRKNQSRAGLARSVTKVLSM